MSDTETDSDLPQEADALMMSERSDASLVVAIGRFDEPALAETYQRHGGAVFALSRRLLKRRDLAEDVTQEIFMRLWTRPERFDPDRGSLRTFLLADTHGRSIDLLRSEIARRAREEREARLVPVPEKGPESEVLDNVTDAHIRNALNVLSDDERAAIALAYFDGYSYRQVAEQLGAPEGTVKSRIRTGMRRLKQELAASGIAAT
jgi:RNA polymerase sigma-70 factor (ECF subfamily)